MVENGGKTISRRNTVLHLKQNIVIEFPVDINGTWHL